MVLKGRTLYWMHSFMQTKLAAKLQLFQKILSSEKVTLAKNYNCLEETMGFDKYVLFARPPVSPLIKVGDKTKEAEYKAIQFDGTFH